MVDKELVQEVWKLIMTEVRRGLEERDIQLVGNRKGELYMRMPRPVAVAMQPDEATPAESDWRVVTMSVSDMIADLVFLDRDRPELGLDPKLRWRADRRRKARKIVGQRMSILDAMLIPDRDESLRELYTLGRELPRLAIEAKKKEDDDVHHLVWFENGQPVN